MSKFKVGDIVRVKVAGKSKASVNFFGQTSKVIKTYSHGAVKLELETEDGGFWDDELELVESSESELESLVQKANEASKIFDRFRTEFYDQIEIKSNDYPNWSKQTYNRNLNYEYRIKEKPKFEPFHIGKVDANGKGLWEVSLKDNKVVIGCQKFPVSTLKTALTNLCKENFVDDFLLASTIQARRNGVSWSGHFISWEDAEKILTALEKL